MPFPQFGVRVATGGLTHGGAWLARQITEAFPWASAPGYLVRDNDRAYGAAFRSRVRALGIRDRPISPGSPWQNPYVERLIGTVRRECLDGMLVFGEAHLRQILSSYAAYYNEVRTHLALGKDAPLGRAVQRTGVHCSHPNLVWAAPPLRPDMIFGRHRVKIAAE
jgi:transposase InsO family protein